MFIESIAEGADFSAHAFRFGGKDVSKGTVQQFAFASEVSARSFKDAVERESVIYMVLLSERDNQWIGTILSRRKL